MKLQGCIPHKVANLNEFWDGQDEIVLLDPNLTALPECKEIFRELIDTKAVIDFSQGLDIRLMDSEKIQLLSQMRIHNVHFAWDRYRDREIIQRKLLALKQLTGWKKNKVTIYVLVNFDSTIQQDLERIYWIRDVVGFTPYVMRYDKEHIPRGSDYNKLARWVNSKQLLFSVPTFEEYKKLEKEGKLH